MHLHGLDIAPATPEQIALFKEVRAVEANLSLAQAARLASPEGSVRWIGSSESDIKGRVQQYVDLIVAAPVLEEHLEELRVQMHDLLPARELAAPKPLDIAAVRQFVSAAGRTAALSYFITDQSFVIRAFTSGGRSWQLSLAQPRADELFDLVQRVVRPLHARRPPLTTTADDRAAAITKLSEILLGPLPAEFWQDTDTLIVVPDGPLYYIPFDVLPSPVNPNRLIVDDWRTVYAPSLTVLGRLAEIHTDPGELSGEFIGFGDPVLADIAEEGGDLASWLSQRRRRLVPLPGTRVEVKQIAAEFGDGGKVVVGPDFTEAQIRSLAPKYRYVHFATHGLLDNIDSLYSGLVLSPPIDDDQDGDSFLQVYEMPQLGLHADMVVCSACQTGIGEFRAGEGIAGMGHALLAGGARTVVLSLWPTPDMITIRFMTNLYTVLRTGASVAEALRRARLMLRQRHSDPYYWAPFIGVGLADPALAAATRLP